MGPHNRRTSPRIRGTLAGIERRAREISGEYKFKKDTTKMLSDIMKEIKKIKKILNSQP